MRVSFGYWSQSSFAVIFIIPYITCDDNNGGQSKAFLELRWRSKLPALRNK